MTIRVEFSTADGKYVDNWNAPPPWLPEVGDHLRLGASQLESSDYEVIRRRWVVGHGSRSDEPLAGWIEIHVQPVPLESAT